LAKRKDLQSERFALECLNTSKMHTYAWEYWYERRQKVAADIDSNAASIVLALNTLYGSEGKTLPKAAGPEQTP
jgi:hypothetical protein